MSSNTVYRIKLKTKQYYKNSTANNLYTCIGQLCIQKYWFHRYCFHLDFYTISKTVLLKLSVFYNHHTFW